MAVGGLVACGGSSGSACDSDQPCRSGLVCNAGFCEPSHATAAGESCTIGAECVAAMQCLDGRCSPEGHGDTNDHCTEDADCRSNLRCTLEVASPRCAATGSSDELQPCSGPSECYQGLYCHFGACVPGAPWAGVDCSASAPEETRAYFEVAGAPGAALGDFFRFPFPSDASRAGDRLSLSEFPAPTSIDGSRLVQAYVEALESTNGWGISATVTFRFSGPLAPDSLDVAWLDLTEGAPEYGHAESVELQYRPRRSAYVCEDALFVRRAPGKPMLPSHTYAVVVGAATTVDAAAVQSAPDFLAMLKDETPADAALARVHEAFSPLRKYYASQSGPPAAAPVVATVLTTRDVRAPMASLADAVRGLPAPSTRDWIKCDTGRVSPCDEGQDLPRRPCEATPEGAGYDEYQALVRLPIFQRGSPPYYLAGGETEADPTRDEDVCLTLTLPKTAMPERGFPLVLFAHGTGGSSRSHVTKTIAGALAASDAPFAVLGIDQAQHGSRRNSSMEPAKLFYNFLNPYAAVGNPLQGAADQLGLLKLAKSFNRQLAGAPESVRFDAERIVFWGHSQGATHGSLALPYAEGLKGAVLSGNGAGLIDALLEKHEPVDVTALAADALQDPFLAEIGAFHPVLALLANWEDPADPLSFAALVARAPLADQPPKNVFQVYGQQDNFAPGTTMASYILAAGLDLVAADASVEQPDPIGSLVASAPPLAGNVTTNGMTVTAGARQYAPPPGSDGHFVAFDVPSANHDVVRFLTMAALDRQPEIGP